MPKSASVTLTVTEKGNLTVTVQDGSGSAISNATVELSGASSENGTTDSSGIVEFTHIPIGDYTITAVKDTADTYLEGQTSISSGDFS